MVRGILLAYVVIQHIKLAHILLCYNAYWNLHKEMIARDLTDDAGSNLQRNKDWLNKKYLYYQCDSFKINNASVYNILSRVFTDLDVFVYKKQRKSSFGRQAVIFDIHQQYLGPYHVDRQVAEAGRNLQSPHCDSEKKKWD